MTDGSAPVDHRPLRQLGLRHELHDLRKRDLQQVVTYSLLDGDDQYGLDAKLTNRPHPGAADQQVAGDLRWWPRRGQRTGGGVPGPRLSGR